MGNSVSDHLVSGGASDQDDDAIRRALQLMAEALTQLQGAVQAKGERAWEAFQEALRLYERRLEGVMERVEEVVRASEQRMQEKIDDVVRSLEEKMNESVHRMEAKCLGKEELTIHRDMNGQITSSQPSRVLEERMEALEKSVQRALVAVLPKVETLLAQLEGTSALMVPSENSNASASYFVGNTTDSSLGHCTTALPCRTTTPLTATKGTFLPPSTTMPTSSNQSNSAFSNVPTATIHPDSAIPTLSPTDSFTSHPRSTTTNTFMIHPVPRNPNPTQRDLEKDLVRSSYHGRIGRVNELLDAGVGISSRDDDGRTALHRAAFKGFADVALLLLRRGAEIDAKERHGFTPLHLAAVGDARGTCVFLLVNRGANVNARNIAGETPLHYAASHCNEAAVKVLVAKGANKSIKSIPGRTPSDCASNDTIRRLLRS